MSSELGTCSILEGILQNGSAYNYPAVRFGRVPKREKAKILAAMQSSRMKTQESKVMGELNDDAKIIDCIVRAHYDTCDYTRKKMEPFLQRAKANPKYISCCGTTCPMKGRPEESFMEQFSERFMDHVRQVCTFAKLIPGFKCLHHDDQVTLLKSCVFEVLLVRLAGLFDNQSLVCLNGDIIRKDTINAMPPGNAKFLMDSVFELAQRMNQFRLSDAEIGLFCAVVIITPDRPGLRNPELLTRIQNKLKMVLNSILLPQHPENESIFPELMTMVHDLRTLNTLHTEKFLQQCKINESINPGVANNSSVVNFEASQQRWDSVHLDRESTGNGSPQSSSGGDTHSSTSLEDTSSRRSPMGSVSSTDSSSSTCEVSKLLSTVQDLRMNNNGSNTNNSSVLMTALTSNGGVTISRKASVSTPVTTTCPMVGTSTVSSLKYKTARKVESPNDSGIELSLNHVASAAASMATYSTNNSVCSSPRSSSESLEKRSTSSASPPSEERHPLLKRALQQPPQLYNNGVATFQDEVYKPHKKFRRHTNSFSKSGDDCPSSSTQRSSSPEVPMSLLASQLAEPIQSYQLHHAVVGRSTASRATPPAPGVPASISSLLASTLSQRIPMASEESKRNEILAQLILDGGHLQRRYQPQQPQKQQQQPHQGLLMCAPVTTSSTSTSSSSSSFASWEPRASTSIKSSCSGPPHTSRHIPVATLPTKPNRQAAAATASKASSTVTSGEIATSAAASVLQPLNLSKRTTTSTSSATSSASLSSSSTTTSSSTEASSDIPTEA